MSTHAYLYRWTEISTGRWYIGSRAKSGCHPDDGYLCSSKVVKPLILENRDNWKREVLCVGPAAYIRELETALLVACDAAEDPMSFNQQNQNGRFSRQGLPSPTKGKVYTEEERQKISEAVRAAYDRDPSLRQRLSAAKKGKPGRPQTEEERAKRSATLTGRVRSEAHCQALSEAHKARPRDPHSEETKQKIGAARKGIPRSEETKQKIRDTMMRKKLEKLAS